MNARLLWAPSLAIGLLVTASTGAAEPATLVAKIDQLIAQRWAEAKVEPAARADDAEFLRRVYLDLAGRIPSVDEVAHLPRRQAGRTSAPAWSSSCWPAPRYVTHFTNVWRALLLPEAGNNFQVRLQQGGFEALAQAAGGAQRRLRPDGPRPADRADRGGGAGPLALAGFRRAGSAGVLPRQGVQAGEPGRQHGPGLPRRQRRVRPVPQPPLRRLEARAVLGLRRLLRRHQVAAADGLPAAGRRRRRQARADHPGHREGRAGEVPRRQRAGWKPRPAPAPPWPTG